MTENSLSAEDSVIGLYERHARAYDRDRSRSLQEVLGWIGSSSGRDGARRGQRDGREPLASHLVRRGVHVVGVDASPSMIERCRARFPDSEWIVADMRDLDLGRRFDGILAWDSFFHLDMDDQRRMFPRFASHVRTGAPLMFTSGPAAGEAMDYYREQPVESPPHTDLLADVLWQRVGQTSLEHCRLSRPPGKFVLQGVLLVQAEAAPRQIHYGVSCGRDWVTRAIHVTMIQGRHIRRLHLERDHLGIWRRGSEVLPEFAGLIDVDLQITPSTNTLPIRRLRLGEGESADTDALWIRFPDLSLERLTQRYTRTGELRYTYESRGGAFRADLEVDEEGVVVRYGDIWRRV